MLHVTPIIQEDLFAVDLIQDTGTSLANRSPTEDSTELCILLDSHGVADLESFSHSII